MKIFCIFLKIVDNYVLLKILFVRLYLEIKYEFPKEAINWYKYI